MRNNLLTIFILTPFLLLSCKNFKKEKVENITISNKKKLEVIERFFPKEKSITKHDTIIMEENLKITIQNTLTDSYVVNEFEIDGQKYIDKYRNCVNRLIIEKSNELILDTIFKKRDFIKYTGPDFQNIATFRGYWFNQLKNDTIELFGMINKPETDWSFNFHHYFDLNSKTFLVKEYLEEDQMK